MDPIITTTTYSDELLEGIMNNTAVTSEHIFNLQAKMDLIGNILTGFIYLFFVVVAILLTRWVLKNIIFKWINYFFRFNI